MFLRRRVVVVVVRVVTKKWTTMISGRVMKVVK